MRLLDLFCGAGGAAMGYHQAMPDLEITGVDIHPQPHYPFNFIQADANELSTLSGYDIIHASPPCEGHTVGRWTEHDSYDLLHQAIRKLRENDSWLWVVENVTGVIWDGDFILCGAAMGNVLDDDRLYLKRHRKFWSNQPIVEPECRCRSYKHQGYRCAGLYGGNGGQHHQGRGYRPPASTGGRLMGIDWMNRREMAQAIPPSYTRHILTEVMNVSWPSG